MGEVVTIGLDIAKSVFQVHGVGAGVYRDQSFVYANCIELARKLKSLIEDGQAGDTSIHEPLGLPAPAEHKGE